ncbi:hypothetical protein PtA15_4A656 [Puccinia triticina]|uniref:Uncharacterized protein n=1 Tax=Puccinia triticina TaxID=208348 RepID=A0ABY7CHQ8_9BASI|nr:uncharacterized protein PtA15_4A656 [Puccinia triticina]WAQ84204.1 hypothetical protein PtA15_4A656 [Puccinia triticina]
MSLLYSEDSGSDGADDDSRISPEPVRQHTSTGRSSANTQESQIGPIRQSERRERNAMAGRRDAVPLRGAAAIAAAGSATTGRQSSTPGARRSTDIARPAAIPPVPGSVATGGQAPRRVGLPAIPTFPNVPFTMLQDNEPVTDAFLGELEGVFELRGGYADLAENLVHVPPPRQWAVQMYSQMSIRQAIDEARQQAKLARVQAVMQPPPTVRTNDFHYVPVFSEFVKRSIRELLMSKNLKMYSSDLPRGNHRHNVRGLLSLVLDRINAQPVQFRLDYLPHGYNEAEPSAVASVERFVRRKLRNSRGKMRDLLLTDIHNTECWEDIRPVPTISTLLAEMQTSLLPLLPNNQRNVPAGEQNAPRGHQTHMKARLAYLRIHTIGQLVSRGPRDTGRQWLNIDSHLRELDEKGREYRTSFFQLVLDYDRNTFGHTTMSQLDRESISLPTEEEVRAHMARITADNLNLDEEDVAQV